ncbi:PREDICTED: uncharacterized protein LOC108545683 [Eufriesea mexicana]|uniref:uncharacterized protein LOC108545683 n=1 Tax=Eufriesea mexicana TaxID=516756 RepID=UPI00083BDC7D|nr:PREDICTED: uncharacterized protein LOC108545683 [Eufriesea mexicana]
MAEKEVQQKENEDDVEKGGEAQREQEERKKAEEERRMEARRACRTEAMSSNLHNVSSFFNYTRRDIDAAYIWVAHTEAWKKTREEIGVVAVHRLLHAGRTFDVEYLRRDTHATCDKMPTTLPALCLVTLVLCNVYGSLEHEIPRRSFLSRRAIDGTRGRKYFDPEEEGAFDSYGSAGGQYDPYQQKTDLSDIRKNVPGEPRIGYYADEVAGCQVFHVCHDVLVSSFLCPIGSVFSQKLLTCDWWTKVDCSSSSKYIGVNRNSYQQDDDEMIRNAYAMISLQSGTDVTKDGLVDPDRTGSVVDYQRGPDILDYSPVDTSGNDLRTNFQDYPRPANRDFLPPYQLKERKPETGRSYQDAFYPADKSRSPYEDSPIIRVQKINDPGYGDRQRTKDFQEAYRRPNEFTNQFQPSYAPTVPTVTTTTRRFYSPTVPTTFRPSTLAYNKLDQVIDSSDYYFSHSRARSFVTPPTKVFPSGDSGRQDFGRDLRKPEPFRKSIRDEDYSRQDSYEDDYEDFDSEESRSERPKERFQVRVADDFNFNRTGALNGRSSVFGDIYRGFDRTRNDEDTVDDIETRGSIGLGQALHQSLRGISVHEQDPVKDETKAGESNSRKEGIKHTLVRPESTNYSGEEKQNATENYQRHDQRDTKTKEAVLRDADIFVSTTTPSVVESTIKASTSLHESPNRQRDLRNTTDTSSEFLNGRDSVEAIDSGFQTFRPTEIPEPPQKTQSKFQINVPDLSEVSTLLFRYSTLGDETYQETRTTELPKFQSSTGEYVDHTSSDENAGVTSSYEDIEIYKGSNFQNYPTTVARPLVSSTPSWLPSSSRDQSDVDNHPKDYANDFIRTGEDRPPQIDRLDLSLKSTNDTEFAITSNRNSGLRFVTDAAVPSTKPPSLLISTGSTSNIAKTISPVGSLDSSRSTLVVKTFEDSSPQLSNEPSTPAFEAKSIGIEYIDSTSRPVTHRSTEESRDVGSSGVRKPGGEKDTVEASTANALYRTIRPETLRQIEETIEKNNSPYHVTLTMSKDAQSATGVDLISQLLAQQGKEMSTVNDEAHELEIIRSVEPEIQSTTKLQATTMNILDTEHQPNLGGNVTTVERSDFKKRSSNMVSLLHLMSELLKLDRVPRPFALSETQNPEPRTRSEILHDILSTTSSRALAKAVHSNIESQNGGTSHFQETSTEPNLKSSAARSKEEILDQLADNLGEPIYRADGQPAFDLRGEQRLADFQTVIPLKSTSNQEEFSSVQTTVTTTARPSSREITRTTTTTSTPKITFTTEPEKTVVKTEFVPSIGFSLDTDAGREEYVEAVLGGLIEPQTAESEKKETILKEELEEETLSKKNETSGKI